MDSPIFRRHPLVLGTVAAVVALLAAVGAVAAWAAIDDDDPDERTVDATLRFTPDDEDPDPLVEGDRTGEPVPTASFAVLEGGLGSLGDYQGTPLVLNFFGSWCVPCRKEVPDLQSLYEELDGEVAFLGLAVRDSARDAKAFVEKYGVTYDVGRDPNGALFSELGGLNMPSTFLISPEGRVVAARPGAVDADTLRSLIEEHLR